MLAGAFDYDLEPKTRVRLFEAPASTPLIPQQVVHTGETTLRATPSYPMALSPWRFRWWAPAPPGCVAQAITVAPGAHAVVPLVAGRHLEDQPSLDMHPGLPALPVTPHQ